MKLLRSKSKIVPVDKFIPSDFDVKIDSKKATKLLGFNPVSIEDGIKKYIKKLKMRIYNTVFPIFQKKILMKF